MSRSAQRWNVLGVAVVVALIVGVVVAMRSGPAPVPVRATTSASVTAASPSADRVRASAALQSCPQGPGTASGPLAGLRLACLGDGTDIDVGQALAGRGRPAVLDLWAWNCAPCAQELPALQAYARQAGDAVTVLTVHSNPATPNGVERLAALDVHLPGVADPTSQLAARLGAPAVLPVTVLVRADGSVAKILAKPYTDPAAISADVQRYLGVAP